MIRTIPRLLSLAACVLLTLVCGAQTDRRTASSRENSLRTFLQDYTKDTHDRAARYSSAFVDLRGDGTRQVIVYLFGDGWCGSGGCTTLVLTSEGSSYRLVTKITITRLPIRVLKSTSNGWHDITVRVGGGGILRSYESELKFDGNSYLSNPSVPPAQELKQTTAGEVAISDQAEGIALYP